MDWGVMKAVVQTWEEAGEMAGEVEVSWPPSFPLDRSRSLTGTGGGLRELFMWLVPGCLPLSCSVWPCTEVSTAGLSTLTWKASHPGPSLFTGSFTWGSLFIRFVVVTAFVLRAVLLHTLTCSVLYSNLHCNHIFVFLMKLYIFPAFLYSSAKLTNPSFVYRFNFIHSSLGVVPTLWFIDDIYSTV